MTKPIVEFGSFVGLGKHPHSQEPNAALRDVTGHPNLGDESIVYTSRIERIGYDESGKVCEVETRNTVYRRREAMS